MSYEIKVEDVEYLRHGDVSLLARLYRPQGTGPFPIMVELHGGAFFDLAANGEVAAVERGNLATDGEAVFARKHQVEYDELGLA